MVAIPTILVVWLVWLPALASVYLSFTKWNGFRLSGIEWIGTKNYVDIVTIYPPFWPAIQNNLIWLVFLFVLPTILGMLLAVILDREMWGSRFYQTAFYLPVVLSLALVGFIWQLFYSTDQGLINQVFGTNVDWYGDPDVNIWAVLVATAWRHTGYIMLLYLAGLKGVDASLREAAAVDGASETKTFFQVIFPVMRPINLIVLVIVVIESLRAFDLVWVINKGRNGLELISALVSQNVIGEATRYGFGSALVGDHDGHLLGVHRHLPADRLPGGAVMSATTTAPAPAKRKQPGARPQRRRAQPPPRQGRHGRHAGAGPDLAVPAALVALQLLPRLLLHADQRLPVLRRVDARQLQGGVEPRQLRSAPEELAAHHDPGGGADPVPVLADRLRARAVLLQVQPHPARASSSPPTCCRRRRCSSRSSGCSGRSRSRRS